MPAQNTVVVICGPTAVGKTSIGIQLAQQFNTDIISADSRQCYKELNIGVAKPSEDQLKAVRHYFINSHSVHEEVNAGVFERYSLNATNEIFLCNRIAVMVGGTGLYIKAFTDGIDNMPVTPEELRQEINNDYVNKGLSWLQNQVQLHDPKFWSTAEQQNPHRLIRALEVFRLTGKSITDFRKGNKAERDFRIIKIGLQLPREGLNRNINSRVDQMIEDGLGEEVQSLLALKHLKALQTVGYRELFEYFDETTTLQQAITNIKTNTRQYAKRQMTWFKKDKEIIWHTVGQNSSNQLSELINQEINR